MVDTLIFGLAPNLAVNSLTACLFGHSLFLVFYLSLCLVFDITIIISSWLFRLFSAFAFVSVSICGW